MGDVNLTTGLEFKLPLDETKSVECNIPNPGVTVRLFCPMRYCEDLPAYKLGEPSIQQAWPLVEDEQPPDVRGPRCGNFDLDAYKQALTPDGKAVSLEFKMPAELTSVQLAVYCRHWDTAFLRVYDRLRFYTIMLRPSDPWQDRIESIPLPTCP